MSLLRFTITSETVFGGGDAVSARVKVVTEGGVSGEGSAANHLAQGQQDYRHCPVDEQAPLRK